MKMMARREGLSGYPKSWGLGLRSVISEENQGLRMSDVYLEVGSYSTPLPERGNGPVFVVDVF